jgi:hypothetical protein
VKEKKDESDEDEREEEEKEINIEKKILTYKKKYSNK